MKKTKIITGTALLTVLVLTGCGSERAQNVYGPPPANMEEASAGDADKAGENDNKTGDENADNNGKNGDQPENDSESKNTAQNLLSGPDFEAALAKYEPLRNRFYETVAAIPVEELEKELGEPDEKYDRFTDEDGRHSIAVYEWKLQGGYSIVAEYNIQHQSLSSFPNNLLFVYREDYFGFAGDITTIAPDSDTRSKMEIALNLAREVNYSEQRRCAAMNGLSYEVNAWYDALDSVLGTPNKTWGSGMDYRSWLRDGFEITAVNGRPYRISNTENGMGVELTDVFVSSPDNTDTGYVHKLASYFAKHGTMQEVLDRLGEPDYMESAETSEYCYKIGGYILSFRTEDSLIIRLRNELLKSDYDIKADKSESDVMEVAERIKKLTEDSSLSQIEIEERIVVEFGKPDYYIVNRHQEENEPGVAACYLVSGKEIRVYHGLFELDEEPGTVKYKKYNVVVTEPGEYGPDKKEDQLNTDYMNIEKYVYEGEGMGSECWIQLHGDGSYTWYAGYLSSYIGMGKWELKDDILTFTEKDFGSGPAQYRFKLSDGYLEFIADGSDQMYTVKNGEKFNYVKTGMLFAFSEEGMWESAPIIVINSSD